MQLVMSTNPNNLPQKIEIVDNSKKNDAYTIYQGPGAHAKFNKAINAATEKYNGISRGALLDTFESVRPNISARPEATRQDYEYFRPSEALPRRYKQIVIACDNLYYSFELVRNVIDLMSDFACQGIKFVHPVKSQERFYNAWFQKINGFDRSERFLSNLFRYAMVVMESRNGTIPIDIEKEYYSYAGELKKETKRITSKSLPLQYIFHFPGIVTPVNNINSDQVIYEVEVMDKNVEFSSDVPQVGYTGQKRRLEPDRTYVAYYKKDDWYVKPIPILYPLIQHAIMIKKLALADSAALDGAISAVRIFKLGNLEYKIAPTDAAVAKLDEILQSNVVGGTLDIIWGPDIELIESKTDVHNFLGEEKYVPHLQRLYEGLGIPPTLSGHGGTGTTNNYVSLKVLMKRLQYGRKLLLQFWESQIKIVQKAMGFARPARVEFDFLDLGDEASEKALLIQLADRNLISDEKLQSIFGYDADMEKARMNRESRERRSGRRVDKRSALSDTLDDALYKIALQKGFITPAQLGMELEAGTEKEKSPFDKQLEVQKQKGNTAPIGKTGKQARGRPYNSKDTTKRKQKAFKPKIKASLAIWATDAQNKITDIVKPEFLNLVGKSNLRQLTEQEAIHYEKIMCDLLFATNPFDTVDTGYITKLLTANIKNMYSEFITYVRGVELEMNRHLSLEERRRAQLFMYCNLMENNDGES